MDSVRARRDRNNPVRRKSSESDFSLMEFTRLFPDDSACLDQLWRDRFAPDGHHAHCPRCERERKFHRTKTRASYTCDTCGLHIHPQKGTIFERSSTSLQLWFYTIEGAFGNMKTGMRGAYKKVSPRYLQSYLDEYAWRHKAKREGSALFTQLLIRATSATS
jgi:ISXO2-like transposase domain